MRCTSLLAALATLALPAQEVSPAGDPLEGLLAVPVTVASRKAMALRASPAILTVFTREEIQASGARDLLDVLMLVPGFYAGFDVTGSVGVGMRGVWAYEGKLLFLLDGMELPESLYGNLPLLGHLPLATIRRIEIVRGPGSLLYGGYAELAVVQIFTDRGDALDGRTSARITGSRMGDTTGRGSLEFATGASAQGVTWSIGGFAGRSLESDQVFKDANHNTVDLAEEQRVQNLHLNAALDLDGTDLRLLLDQYTIRDTNRFGTVVPPRDNAFESYHLQGSRAFRLRNDLTLSLTAGYRWQKPWDTSVTTIVERANLSGILDWDLGTFNLEAGIDLVKDWARLGANATPADWFQGGTSSRMSLDRQAAFAQVTWHAPIGDLTLGAREERSAGTRAFVPRVAFTRTWDHFHLKLLWAEAFRTPILGNIAYNPDLEAEETRALEAEVGFRVGAGGLLTLNGFRNALDKPIVYRADPATGVQSYFNTARLESEGLEAEYHHRAAWGHLAFSWAWVRAVDNAVDIFQVPGHPKDFLAVPAQKGSFRASFHLGWGLSLDPTAVYLASRHGYQTGPAPGPLVLAELPASTILGLQVRWQQHPDAHGWTASLGVQDLLNERPPFLQAYNGGHPGLPGPSREILLRLGYGF